MGLRRRPKCRASITLLPEEGVLPPVRQRTGGSLPLLVVRNPCLVLSAFEDLLEVRNRLSVDHNL
jgi:hypothetical protein